jgi:glucose-1-phosphate thymidylyltransferase
MLAGIRDILIIVNKGQLSQFRKILSDGSRFGVKIKFLEQDSPKGLPDAFILGEKFIGKDNVSLILGDNFFYAQSLTKKLNDCIKLSSGCKVLLHPVNSPNLYGVATINKNKKILKLVEKPKKSKSNLAVTGLYFFDNKVIEYSKTLKPSGRNEIEIIDLLNKYKKKNKLKAEFLGRGGAWLDTGSISDFYNASSFVSALENRQGLKIACLEEIAFNYKWINKKQVENAIKFYGNCLYSQYLNKILK